MTKRRITDRLDRLDPEAEVPTDRPPAWFRRWYEGVRDDEWIRDEWQVTLEQADYPEQPPIETTRERALDGDVLTDESWIATCTLKSVEETNGGDLGGKKHDSLGEAGAAESGPDPGLRDVERQ